MEADNRPRWSLWGRSVSLILLIGLCVSVCAFRIVRNREIESARGEFHIAAASSEYAVRREIESNLAALASLRAFIALTPKVDAAAFESFAHDAIRSNPTILTLEWAPRIDSRDRGTFEKQLRARGIVHSYIRGSLTVNPRAAAPAPEYFPIEFMSPRTESERVVGFDVGSAKGSREFLKHAADTRGLTVGGRVRVVEKSQGSLALPSTMAVFEGDPGNARIRGYVLSLCQMGDVFERGLKRLNPDQIDIEFYDLGAPAGRRFLYGHHAGLSAYASHYKSENLAFAAEDFKQIVRFDVGGRTWAMVLFATEAYRRAHTTWLSWTILALIAGTSGVAALHFALHMSHTRRDAELRYLRSRKDAEDALRASEERYALAANGSNDGLWDWDLQTGRIFYSERWKAMLGLDSPDVGDGPDEWMGRLYPADRSTVEAELARHCAGETSHFQSEYRILHKDGSYHWMLSRGVAVRSSEGIATRLAGSQTDITENKAADPLTGLASRVLLNEKLQLAIDQMRLHPEQRFAVLFLDLDRFKVVNDSLGHLAGDRLLLSIARRLISCLEEPPFSRARPLAARLGGDEFVILIGGEIREDLPLLLADRIREKMLPAFDLDGHHVFVTTSIGVRPGHADATPESLLLDSDMAMYHAKARGKQRYEVFEAAMRLEAVERLRIETDLRDAIDRDELVVFYQPKVCLRTGEVAELEALVRWQHPQRGLVSPCEFIPLAEETGLILQLGACVLRKACRQMALWLRYSKIPAGVRVSVNLSGRQFNVPDLFEQVMGVLDETGLPEERLSLEVTEGALMDNIDYATEVLGRFRARNIGLQIDDFGTGYSSLNYLRRLPFDGLKIDRSFVYEHAVGRGNGEIVNTIAFLGRALGMKVVAEGVETESQLRMLIAAGCDYAQGNLLSPARSAEDSERFFSGFADVVRRCVLEVPSDLIAVMVHPHTGETQESPADECCVR